MIDLIVFNVGSSHYALNIENIQRIIQIVKLTEIPNAHDLIDGMISYEGSVIKVLNFRKIIGLPPHKDENKSVEDSSLKLLFYENGSARFAIKVDSIDDIAHVKDSQIMNSDEKQNISEFLELSGVLDLDGVLINVIKTLKLPS
ncbi:protein containing CheW-like protein domain [Sulfurimonas gotlandica GD1]|jgi:chemotaxis signal transduction protein|uniref:Protein containing CheW-like protein domain n=1 Tax=Sulfurimonas gotlandica (strain DSM 19862 / JCM 16533 / GD1) TaxID=929558 RepID=B6BNV0_SULGG|nr:chemotaxis protein CheW [Sulfurimonas gotlandica]EDZ61272.1 putative CheW-like domain protein [Sulfurimonas gotlandica GD1]EHP28904.1 protein containing CheW-like protein domain [Sulfurimonas gotlandica GD1]